MKKTKLQYLVTIVPLSVCEVPCMQIA